MSHSNRTGFPHLEMICNTSYKGWFRLVIGINITQILRLRN